MRYRTSQSEQLSQRSSIQRVSGTDHGVLDCTSLHSKYTHVGIHVKTTAGVLSSVVRQNINRVLRRNLWRVLVFG